MSILLCVLLCVEKTRSGLSRLDLVFLTHKSTHTKEHDLRARENDVIKIATRGLRSFIHYVRF